MLSVQYIPLVLLLGASACSAAAIGGKDQPRFILNPGKGEKELKTGDAASVKGLSSYKGVKFIIHGLGGHYEEDIYTALSDAYQKKKKDQAVIAVDWAHQSFHKDAAILLKYEKAVKNTIDVGASIAEFIKFLVKQKAIKSLGVVHLVGFSLGAHVAGVTGNLLGGKVGRITGLDPAGPSFKETKALKERLDKTDAKYVDVYHTDAGALGTSLAIGHADFFPNGGKQSCTGIGCGHGKAPEWFAKSITDSKFASACKCDSWEDFKAKKCDCKKTVQYGEGSKPGTSGKYYLKI